MAADDPGIPGRADPGNRMEVVMTGSKQPKIESETKTLSEESLNQVAGGIIAVMPAATSAVQQKAIIAVKPQQVVCDGSVKPV